MGEWTSIELQEMRQALHGFCAAYRAYLDEPRPETRSAVVRAIPEADVALRIGGGGTSFIDPPAMGPYRQEYQGLPATAFLHEQPGWGCVHDRPTFQAVLHGIEQADAVLSMGQRQALQREATEARRRAVERRNAFYWLDRGVRLALMVPAYLVSVVLGESASKIDRSAWGLPLRLLAVAADALGVYGAGKGFHWWWSFDRCPMFRAPSSHDYRR